MSEDGIAEADQDREGREHDPEATDAPHRPAVTFGSANEELREPSAGAVRLIGMDFNEMIPPYVEAYRRALALATGRVERVLAEAAGGTCGVLITEDAETLEEYAKVDSRVPYGEIWYTQLDES